MDLKTEHDIIKRAKKHPEAFGVLFDAYYPAIFGYILKRTADPAIAEDIVAETFLKAFQNIRRFKWKDVSISNWFYKIAINELRIYFRKSKYTPNSLEWLFEHDGFEPISDQDLHQELVDAQSAIERQLLFVEAQAVLVRLPLKYQEVLSLRFVEQKKLREISLILGKREGTVKSLVSRGLSLLRDQLVQPNEAVGIIESEGQLLTKPQEPA